MPVCPVCQNLQTTLWSSAEDFEYHTSDKVYNYFSCNRCSSIFIDPIPIAELNAIYPANYYSFVSTRKNVVVHIKEWLDKQHFKRLLKYITCNEIKVLDVGGGTGWLAHALKKTDSRVVLTQIVDIDEKAKVIAEANGHLYFKGILEEFETAEKYHLILMLNLIEHVSDPLAVLQKASSMLSPQGIILIKTPNTISWDAQLFKSTYWGGLHCPRHWVIFSERSFRMLLMKTVLKVENLYYTQGGPFWAFSIIVWLYKNKLVTVTAERPVIFHPLFPLVSAAAALLDFIRRPFSKTSQMFIVLKQKNNNVD